MGQSNGTLMERAQLNITLNLEQSDAGENPLVSTIPINKTVKVVGPGDVIGISDRAIIRTEPKHGITNFEANSLVYIEFYEEDFLWRYTPASPANEEVASRRLRPWLALIVLKENEYQLTESKNSLPILKLEESMAEGALHNEKNTWAWGHVHMNHSIGATTPAARTAEVSQELTLNPDVGMSRLLCPRKLLKETRYQAFIIPAFETGRLAGLGEETAGIPAQKPSWKKGDLHTGVPRPLEFPVYYRWSFNTGRFGDFESLVSILKPVIIGSELGKRAMDIQSPGFGLNGVAKSKTLGMEGALKPPGFVPDSWPDTPPGDGGDDAQFIEGMREILNLSHDLQDTDTLPDTDSLTNPFYNSEIEIDPIVTPPLYGHWHALVNHLAATDGKKWLRTLNLDPRNRGAAGLGTATIQKNQEKLMHEAWLQIGEINEANQKIREAQLVKRVNKNIYAKHLVQGTDDYMVNATTAIHRQLSLDGKTVKQNVIESRVPLAANSAAFQRIIRPGKNVNKKMNLQSSINIQSHIVSNFNKENGDELLTAAKLKKAPLASVNFATATTALSTLITTYAADPTNVAKEVFFDILQPNGGDTVPDNVILKNKANTAQFDSMPITAEAKTFVNKLIDAITVRQVVNGNVQVTLEGTVFTEFFDEVPEKYHGNVTIKNGGEVKAGAEIAPTLTLNKLQGLENNFKAFTGLERFTKFKAPELKNTLKPVPQLANILTQKLNPTLTIQKRALHNIKIWNPQLQQLVGIPFLKPIMAYPKFAKPVFEYLRKISQEYIMPNIDKVEKNSITIVQTNQKFIESYMAGLNHEMSRELLWREYPTDQRGTYFRQFWDVKDNILEKDPEKKLDIQEMHTWSQDLGMHENRQASEGATGSDDGYLVLLIRGDVFKKYPNTMVYAQKAIYGSPRATSQRTLPRDLDKDVQYPVFQAELEPDVYLFGFDLSIEKARGHRGDEDPATNPGYFFVLRERPGQTTFGLDDYADDLGNTDAMPPPGPLQSWNDLSWEHTVSNKNDLENYHLDFHKNLTIETPPAGTPHAKWKSNAADLAWILYQNPVIFARHAGEMLPEN